MWGIPSSHLEREENRERFPLKSAGCLSEASFRALGKRERFLAEDVQTANLSLIRFFRFVTKEMNEAIRRSRIIKHYKIQKLKHANMQKLKYAV